LTGQRQLGRLEAFFVINRTSFSKLSQGETPAENPFFEKSFFLDTKIAAIKGRALAAQHQKFPPLVQGRPLRLKSDRFGERRRQFGATMRFMQELQSCGPCRPTRPPLESPRPSRRSFFFCRLKLSLLFDCKTVRGLVGVSPKCSAHGKSQ